MAGKERNTGGEEKGGMGCLARGGHYSETIVLYCGLTGGRGEGMMQDYGWDVSMMHRMTEVWGPARFGRCRERTARRRFGAESAA
jgi:hypothetical protein